MHETYGTGKVFGRVAQILLKTRPCDPKAGRMYPALCRKAWKVSQVNEYHSCPYIVVGSLCVMEGKRSWTCVRHRRVVCQTHCEECRLVLTRTPSF